MTSRNMREAARRNQAAPGSYALSKEELLRELQKEREREVVRLQQADAAKTARLRALRLAKEAAEAASAASLLKGASVPE